MTVLNAFQSVRPRGVDMPSAVPVVAKAGQAPAKRQAIVKGGL